MLRSHFVLHGAHAAIERRYVRGMKSVVRVMVPDVESLIDTCIARRMQRLAKLETRVRLTAEEGSVWLAELSSRGARMCKDDEACDVEIVASELVLRAVLARPREAVALLLLGKLRVRGDMGHIDALAKLVEGDD